MPSGYLYFQLVASEPITGGTELQLWATPNTMDYLDQRSESRKGRTRPANLREQVDENAVQIYAQNAQQMWPTPRAKEAGDYCYSRGDHDKPALTLSGAAKLWPTPKSQNARGSGEAHGDGGQSLDVAVGGQLNPDWVEWLVGLPAGWGDIDVDDVQLPDKPDPLWWDVEPPIPRVATGIPHRVDRLKGYGNIAVPAQFYPIYAAIAEIENNNAIKA